MTERESEREKERVRKKRERESSQIFGLEVAKNQWTKDFLFPWVPLLKNNQLLFANRTNIKVIIPFLVLRLENKCYSIVTVKRKSKHNLK